MNIGIVGNGVVGGAVLRGFVEHVESVLVYDVERVRATHEISDIVKAADFIFVCVPTPRGDAGPLDCSFVSEAIRDITTRYELDCAVSKHCPIIVIKSTVNPGFTEQIAKQTPLPVLHSPEFLTARCADTNFNAPSRNIIGCPCDAHMDAAMKLRDLYERRWPHCPIHVMRSIESELVKLGQNGFFATKVAYFHALAKTCASLGADYETVRRGIASDGRLTSDHTLQPGPDGKYGYGGKCLTKDLPALAAAASLIAPWLSGVVATNDKSRQEQGE